MTAGDVLAVARRDLADADGKRWPDAVLFTYLTDAQEELKRKRPDRFHTGSTPLAVVVASDLTDVLTLPAGNRDTLAAWVTYRALGEDDADKADASRAMQFMGRFQASIGGFAR